MATPAQVWGFVIGADIAADASSAASLLVDDLHLVHGLNPTAPLIVTQTNRDAGPTVSQSLDDTAGIVTVTRI